MESYLLSNIYVKANTSFEITTVNLFCKNWYDKIDTGIVLILCIVENYSQKYGVIRNRALKTKLLHLKLLRNINTNSVLKY